jgi:hypothetical protein
MDHRTRFALRGITAAAAMLAATSPVTLAAVNPFTDRTSFNAAVGGAQVTEDFSSFPVDTPFRTAPVPANGFVLSQEGAQANFRNLVDVPPVAQADNNGTANASSYTNFPEGTAPGTQVRISFPVPVRAFGADFYNTTLSEGLVLDVFAGTNSLGSFPIPLVAQGFTFFGVAGNAGENITSVLLRSQSLTPGTGGEGYGMDDVAVALIPEPTAGTLVAALGSILLARRGRRARQA